MTLTTTGPERVDTVVVGGGQAGLATAREVKQRGRQAVVLDAHERVGDSWRTRWDSLRLFTPRRDCSLPGLRMEGPQSRMPSKDEMADYLERYAEHHALEVRTGVRVQRVSRNGKGFLVETSEGTILAANVVVAAGGYVAPELPGFAAELDQHVLQLHSAHYKNPAQLQSGSVLVVGAGNSGCDIAMDVSSTHSTWLAGPKLPNVPVDIDKWLGRVVIVRVVRFVQRNVLSLRTPIGRKKADQLRHKATPVIRVKPAWLERSGVQRVDRVVGVKDGLPLLADGRVLDITNVVWCTGFRHDFPWLDVRSHDEAGHLLHRRGVSTEAEGLYYVGQPFQLALASASLWGVARDAAYVAAHLARRPAAVAA